VPPVVGATRTNNPIFVYRQFPGGC